MYLFTLQLPSDWVGRGQDEVGWEMQVTENEEMEKKKKKKSCAFSLVVDFDGY